MNLAVGRWSASFKFLKLARKVFIINETHIRDNLHDRIGCIEQFLGNFFNTKVCYICVDGKAGHFHHRYCKTGRLCHQLSIPLPISIHHQDLVLPCRRKASYTKPREKFQENTGQSLSADFEHILPKSQLIILVWPYRIIIHSILIYSNHYYTDSYQFFNPDLFFAR